MVAAENAEQAKAWDGAEGEHWAAFADQYDAALAGYRDVFNARALVRPGDRVLDVGCGNGQSTRDAARAATSGSALGVDLSGAMISLATARAAAEGLTNVRFERADAQVHPFSPASFDLVISRAGVMFFGDRPAAFANLARALRPGGRMMLLVWQDFARNGLAPLLWSALAPGEPLPEPSADAPSPYSMSDPERVRPLLSGAGFTDIGFEAVGRPFRLGGDVDDAMRFASSLRATRALLEGSDSAGRAAALARLRASLEAAATPDGVGVESNAWLITARKR